MGDNLADILTNILGWKLRHKLLTFYISGITL